MSKGTPAGELTDEQLASIYFEATGQSLRQVDNRIAIGFARAIIAADRALRASPAAGDVEPEDFWIRQHASARQAELSMRRELTDAQAAFSAKDANYALGVSMLTKKIAALTAERDALRKDAERYRWLRDSSNWSEDGICPIMASGEDTIYGEHLDQSIDAAMTKEPK